MGQQQLLLLILTIVVVGLAVVAGIEAFDENERKTTIDSITNDAVRLATDIQSWSLRPVAYGGPEDGEGFTNVTLNRIGYVTDDAGTYATLNGQFSLTDTQADCVRLVGTNPDLDGGASTEIVQVVIRGAQPADLETSIEGPAISC